jgi:hypothetical protein
MIPVKKKRFVNPVFVPVYVIVSVFFMSCGIEEYYYLEPVEQIRIEREMNNRATINLPPLTQSYATHYSIFYRIYISGYPTESNSSAEFGLINQTLLSDYNIIYPYTDPTNTTVNIAIESLFRNRSYKELELKDVEIESKLSKSGGMIVIEFPPVSGKTPTLTRGGEAPIPLYRSNGEGTFTPEPDRLFFNSPDLTDNSKATPNINADVAPNTGIPAGQRRYTYVSMYIVSAGMDVVNITRVYSKPTHISIFRLPEIEF